MNIVYLWGVKIFLDIDGVMVPAASWKPIEQLNDGFAVFSDRSISALQHIISQTGASIVLTTSHKSHYSLSEWQNIFLSRGIAIEQIEKLDHNQHNLSRKEEILNWFEKEIEECFVIIDDDKSLNDLPPLLKSHLVLTSAMIGLTSDDATAAIHILRSASQAVA